jgi:hypothetical protein
VPYHGRCAPSAVSRTATDGPRWRRVSRLDGRRRSNAGRFLGAWSASTSERPSESEMASSAPMNEFCTAQGHAVTHCAGQFSSGCLNPPTCQRSTLAWFGSVRKSKRYRPAGPPTTSALELIQAEALMRFSSRIRARVRQLATSQIRIIPSSSPEASQLPSGATATPFTPRVWVVKVARLRPVATSQIRTLPSSLPGAGGSQAPRRGLR